MDKILHSDVSGGRGVVSIIREALAVLAVSTVLAFAANQVSSRGLVVTRNYFPAGSRPSVLMPSAASSPHPATNATDLSPAQLQAARIQEQGFQLIDGRQEAQWFRDSRFQQGNIVFIDARDEARYRAGHIPGAYEFDPYYPEKYFPTALPPCQAAEQIMIYCNGGDCDDSESAAVTLRDVGIANRKLFIYGGGLPDWASNSLPVETGGRNSGNLRPPLK